jgi:serine protease Do
MVLAMGSPFGLSQSVTLGIISAKGRRSLILGEKGEDVINQDFLQTDAAINPGNSGGPLIDLQGRVIGINTAIASQGGGNEGIGFSIPSNLCRQVVDQLLEHGRVQRAFLGVRLDEEFDDTAARRLKLNRVQGARVVQVYGDTPAETAGLQIDDVILTFDGQRIEDQSHLIHLVSLTPVNKTVRMEVYREGAKVTVDVRLSELARQKFQSIPASCES